MEYPTIVKLLSDEFEAERIALAYLEAADMLTRSIDVQFEYHPGDDDAPDGTT